MKNLSSLQNMAVAQLTLGNAKSKMAIAAVLAIGAAFSISNAEAASSINSQSCSRVGATIGSVGGAVLGDSGAARTIGAVVGGFLGQVTGEVACSNNDPRAQNQQRTSNERIVQTPFGQSLNSEQIRDMDYRVAHTIRAKNEWVSNLGEPLEREYKAQFVQHRGALIEYAVSMKNAGYDVQNYVTSVNVLASINTEGAVNVSKLKRDEIAVMNSSRTYANAANLSTRIEYTHPSSTNVFGNTANRLSSGAADFSASVGEKLKEWKDRAPQRANDGSDENGYASPRF